MSMLKAPIWSPCAHASAPSCDCTLDPTHQVQSSLLTWSNCVKPYQNTTQGKNASIYLCTRNNVSWRQDKTTSELLDFFLASHTWNDTSRNICHTVHPPIFFTWIICGQAHPTVPDFYVIVYTVKDNYTLLFMGIKCTYHHSHYASPSQCFVVYSGMLNKEKKGSLKSILRRLIQALICTAVCD